MDNNEIELHNPNGLTRFGGVPGADLHLSRRMLEFNSDVLDWATDLATTLRNIDGQIDSSNPLEDVLEFQQEADEMRQVYGTLDSELIGYGDAIDDPMLFGDVDDRRGTIGGW